MAFCVRARLPATSMMLIATGEVGIGSCPWARAPKAARPAAPAAPPTNSRRLILKLVIHFLRVAAYGRCSTL
jgi:hypothetical protein